MEFISYVLLTYSQKLLSYKKERRSNEKGCNLRIVSYMILSCRQVHCLNIIPLHCRKIWVDIHVEIVARMYIL